MGMIKEFREFALRGNVFDLAVAVVIGAAFGKIVASFVGDVLMPVIGKATGNVTFSDLSYDLGMGKDGKPVLLQYGNFLQTVVDFVIVAFCIFLLIKAVNRLMRKEATAPPPPAPPTKDQELLAEIRDILRTR